MVLTIDRVKNSNVLPERLPYGVPTQQSIAQCVIFSLSNVTQRVKPAAVNQ